MRHNHPSPIAGLLVGTVSSLAPDVPRNGFAQAAVARLSRPQAALSARDLRLNDRRLKNTGDDLPGDKLVGAHSEWTLASGVTVKRNPTISGRACDGDPNTGPANGPATAALTLRRAAAHRPRGPFASSALALPERGFHHA